MKIFKESPIPLGSVVVIAGREYVVASFNPVSETVRFSALYNNSHFVEAAKEVQHWLDDGLEFMERTDILTAVALRGASLNIKERSDWLVKQRYVREALELPARAPKSLQIETIAETYNTLLSESQRSTSQILPDSVFRPNVSSVYRWLSLVEAASGLMGAIAFKDHRAKPRKKRLHKRVERIIRKAIKKVRLVKTVTTVDDVYVVVKRKIKKQNEKRSRRRKKLLKVPSKQTVANRIHSVPRIDQDEAREGPRYVAKKYNSGGSIEFPNYIGSRVEVDTNYVDCLVYDEALDITYRPEWTVLLECSTRCVIGQDFSFVPKGADKTMRALADAMSTENSTGFSVVPRRLCVDGGAEFQNHTLEATCEELGIVIDNGPPGTPNARPHVERFFGTINTRLFHKTRGTTRESFVVRGFYESEHEATYSLEELRAIVEKDLAIYHMDIHSSLNCAPSTQWDLLKSKRPPKAYGHETIIAIGGKTEKRSIQGGRIQIEHLYWRSPELNQLLDPDRDAGKKVKVIYSETDLTNVWVVDPRNPYRFIKCEPCNVQYQTGLTLTIHKMIRQAYADWELATGNADRALDLRYEQLMRLIDDEENRKHRSKKKRAQNRSDAEKELAAVNAANRNPTRTDSSAPKSTYDESPEEHQDSGFGIFGR